MRRILAISLGVALTAGSAAFMAAPAGATGCTSTIVSATASNAVITATGEAAARVTVHAADSCNDVPWGRPGVWSVGVTAYNPGRDVASTQLSLSSGTEQDGTWSGFLKFTSKDSLGTWFVDVNASDYDGQVGSVREASFKLRRNTRVSANARPEPVERGATLRVRGHVTKLNGKLAYVDYRDAVVRIYFRRAGSSAKVLKGRTRTDGRGNYAMTFAAKRSGSWFAYFPGSFANTSRWSGGDRVRVR